MQRIVLIRNGISVVKFARSVVESLDKDEENIAT